MSAFSESFDQHCQTNPEYPEGYDWLLPSYIPKKIGESLENSHYSSLEVIYLFIENGMLSYHF